MDSARQRELLQRFEPVLRFTKGERFFPMDTAPFVGASSLWELPTSGKPVQRREAGELQLEDLGAERPSQPGAVLFLQSAAPMGARELAAERLRELPLWHRDEERFHRGRGRLARVGVASRLVDAAFSLTLLARGRVPGDSAHASARFYREQVAHGEPYRYHGRVLQQDGWTVLQYWYFYAFNDWRSRYHGLNDHEGDWEMVSLYCVECEEGLRPEWVAFASHDFEGDELRRRRDDPSLRWQGEHVVVYPGAGSHASYFEAGEYTTEIALPPLRPLAALRRKATGWLRRLLGTGNGEARARGGERDPFRVAFVDFARGDGLAVGEGGDAAWAAPRLVGDDIPWVRDFRGLWGLYAQDPFGGEDAPSGPRFERDGRVRRSWADPVGWAGLDKLTPPPGLPALRERWLRARREELAGLHGQIAGRVEQLRGLSLEMQALAAGGGARAHYRRRQQELAAASAELGRWRRRASELAAVLHQVEEQGEALEDPRAVAPGAHLRRRLRPVNPAELARNKVAEAWAALSLGLLLLGMVALLLLQPGALLPGALALLGAFTAFEAISRGALGQLVRAVSLLLAWVAAGLLVVEYLTPVLVGLVLALGAWLLLDNLGELRG